MTALEGAVVYEEFGRALAPTPHFVSAVMSAGVLLRAGSDEQKQTWLPQIVTGDAILTTAWLEPQHGFGPDGVQTTARPEGDHPDAGTWVLDGTKWHVPFASAADQFVVLARTPDGVDLFLVDPAAAGVTLTQQLTIASDAQYEVTLSDVSVPAANRIGDAGTGWATWHETMLDGIVLLAAYAIGGARFALETTVQYAKDRQQFDKPLGAFQAVAHYLADASTAVEGGTILVHEAAWAGPTATRSTGSPRWRSCSRARRSATSPPWATRSTAAWASPSSATCSCTSAGPRSSRSPGGTTATSRSSSPPPPSTTTTSHPFAARAASARSGTRDIS